MVNIPLYDFDCEECKKRFEVKASVEDAEKGVHCPKCGKKLKKVITKGNRFSFK